jgi:hypothetical protein
MNLKKRFDEALNAAYRRPLCATSLQERELLDSLASGPASLSELSTRANMDPDRLVEEIGKLYSAGKLEIDGASAFKVGLLDAREVGASSHITLRLTYKGLQQAVAPSLVSGRCYQCP